MKIYFDNAASTKVRDEAIDMMISVMREDYGNPSSMHYAGRKSANILQTARRNVADAISANPDCIYFTSGGTESDNWAILGVAELQKRNGKHILSSAIEHDAVMDSIKKLESIGWEVTYLMPDSAGRIAPEAFAAALRDDTSLASIMTVNNEMGAINPICDYSAEIKRRGLNTLLHTDAVQGYCKIPLKVSSLGADLITMSAHKIHGPKGVGALYIKSGINLPKAQLGGSQENGKRPGTEALPAIAGFGEAARVGALEREGLTRQMKELRDFVISLLQRKLPEAVIIGEGDVPYLLSLSLPGHKSEVLMSYLDAEGICVSKGSACKKGARSRVLESMRLKNEVIDGAIRVSFSRYSTQEEAECFVNTLKQASDTLFKAF